MPAGKAHLDYGCHDGKFLHGLSSKNNVERLVGVDINQDSIAVGRANYPHLELSGMKSGEPLPFADNTFSSISIMDVIEHVYDQKRVIDELTRVLQPGGLLLVTVPKQHLFSFLDLGNLKFRFPRLHRSFFRLRHTEEEYNYRYTANPFGMIGDIEAKKSWHEHFTAKSMKRLLEKSGLQIVEFDGMGFFARPLGVMHYFTRIKLLDRLRKWDSARFESCNLYCIARKPDHVVASLHAAT